MTQEAVDTHYPAITQTEAIYPYGIGRTCYPSVRNPNQKPESPI